MNNRELANVAVRERVGMMNAIATGQLRSTFGTSLRTSPSFDVKRTEDELFDALQHAEQYVVGEEVANLLANLTAMLPDSAAITRNLLPSSLGFVSFPFPQAYFVGIDSDVNQLDVVWNELPPNVITAVVRSVLWEAQPDKLEVVAFVTFLVGGELLRNVTSFERTFGTPTQLFWPYGWEVEKVADASATVVSDSFAANKKLAETILGAVGKTFYAFCSFLQTPRLVSMTREHASRQVQRLASRKRPIFPEVDVVELRRPTYVHKPEEKGEERDWSCRWVVRPHWRNQWYPSEGRHRPKLIDAYVKGPEDKPLKLPNDRIFAVMR